ncbi:hypothetical protein ACOMHN_037827 [Nucella lapillus]
MGINNRNRAFSALAFFTFVCLSLSTASSVMRLDVFHEVLEKYQVGDGQTVLPEAKLAEYLDAVLDRFSCVVNGTVVPGLEAETAVSTCHEKLCMDTKEVMAIAGGNVTSGGVTEEQFHTVSMVTLHFLSKGKHPCGATLKPRAGALTLTSIKNEVVSRLSGSDGHLTEKGVQSFLTALSKLYEGTEHGHSDEVHKNEGTRASRRKRSTTEGHEGHDHAEDGKPRVMEAKCLSADAVLYYLNAEQKVNVSAAEKIEDFATVILYLMSQASAIEDSCRQLPRPEEIVSALMKRLSGHADTLTQQDVQQLMELLQIVPNTGHQDTDSHAGHDHRRRRRSADHSDSSLDHLLSRVRRQAATTNTTATKCYSRAELSAIFDLGDTLTAEQLTRLTPALLYQKLYTQCVTQDTHKEEASSLKWLYGILTVLIVCLCSLLGVVMVPCMKSSVYRLGMALFVGLAVGTLTGDAILHLIPSATGVHAHGNQDGHNHAVGPVVVEDYIWFSLVILAGIYGFYLLEAFFICFWKPMGAKEDGHGHSHDVELNMATDSKAPVEPKEDSKTKNTGNVSLTVMIILGDAVHNFADGLAIGAAFSANTGVGIATGIAVFCHELPHELGDFAVLLKNGLTVRRALMWNLVSSLTAFLGLFISLAVATDDQVQTWIFAVTAGMFLYIALADLMPQITASNNCQDRPVFALNNVGLLLGVFIMLIIAIFEERIIIE